MYANSDECLTSRDVLPYSSDQFHFGGFVAASEAKEDIMNDELRFYSRDRMSRFQLATDIGLACLASFSDITLFGRDDELDRDLEMSLVRDARE